MITDKQFDTLAQLSHFGWGMAITFGGKVVLPGKWYLLVAGLWIAYAGIKEFWWDEKHETPEVRGSSLKDFIFQVAGCGFADLVIILFAR